MHSVKSAVLLTACVLAVACGKDKGPGELLVNPSNNGEEQSFEITQAETLEIPVELCNLSKGGLKVTPYSTNEDYLISASKPEGPEFTLMLTAPELLIEETPFVIGFSALDTVYNRTVEAEYLINPKRAANFVEIQDRANTHAVKPGSIVMFPASVGNSSDNVDFDDVSLVWQDAKGLVTKLAMSEGKIVAVLAEDACGNALVSAVKEGKIVWNYHLWVSGYVPGENDMSYEITTTVDGTDVTTRYALMDRNIGALANDCSVEAHGMFYEWSRPEPISVKPIYDIEGNELTYTYVSTKDTLAALGEKILVDIARSTPMVFYKGSGNTAAKYSWFANDLDEMKKLIEGNLWNSPVKSVYDPCPAGYKLPNAASLGLSSVTGLEKEKVFDGLKGEDSTSDYPYIMGWCYSFKDGPKYYFPLQGDITQDGKYEYYYNPENTLGGYRYLRLWISNIDLANGRGYVMQAHSNTGLTWYALNFNYANAVRCIKE